MRQTISIPSCWAAIDLIHGLIYCGNIIKWNRYTAKHEDAIQLINLLLKENLLKASNKNKAAPMINGLLYFVNI